MRSGSRQKPLGIMRKTIIIISAGVSILILSSIFLRKTLGDVNSAQRVSPEPQRHVKQDERNSPHRNESLPLDNRYKNHSPNSSGSYEDRWSTIIASEAREADQLLRHVGLAGTMARDGRGAAMIGLSDQLSLTFDPVITDFGKYNFIGKHLENVKRDTIVNYIFQNVTGKGPSNSEAFSKAMSANLMPDTARQVINKVANILPFDCWEYATGKGADNSQIDRNKIVLEMLKLDPPTTLNNLSKQPSVARAFNSAFFTWMQRDATNPIKWIQSNEAKLTPEQRSRAYQGIARYAAQQGETLVAQQWASKIVDKNIKAEISKEKWMKTD